MLKLYIHPRCSTCKKAVEYLQEHEIAYEAVDITQQPPTIAELKAMLEYIGDDLRKLFNTSGQQYRAMNLKDKLADLSTDDALALLADHGMLIKRPFLLMSDSGTVGFRSAAWDVLLTGPKSGASRQR